MPSFSVTTGEAHPRLAGTFEGVTMVHDKDYDALIVRTGFEIDGETHWVVTQEMIDDTHLGCAPEGARCFSWGEGFSWAVVGNTVWFAVGGTNEVGILTNGIVATRPLRDEVLFIVQDGAEITAVFKDRSRETLL